MFTPRISNSITLLTAHRFEDLKGHVSDLLHTERQEFVLSQELKAVEAEQLKHDADVTFVLKPVQHPHAGTVRRDEMFHTHEAKHFSNGSRLEAEINANG